jgi:Fe-S cluster biogenesis protein NfuA
MPDTLELQQRLGTIEALLGTIDSADPSVRATVQELVELIMSLQGAGLERMLELIDSTGDAGEAIRRKLCNDDLTSSLLILYGLHPMTLEARVAQALDKLRSRLRPLDADVELLSVQDGAIRLRVRADGQGCGSTAQSVKEMVEKAVYAAAPDLTSLTIDGAEEKQSFVPLQMLRDSHPVLSASGKGGV